MGVTTIAYSIPPKMMRRIRADNDNLQFVLDLGEDTARGELEEYNFDERIDETHYILSGCGFVKTAKKLDCENYFYSDSRDYLDYAGCNVWIISPSGVKAMVKELAAAAFEELKEKGLANEVTDYDGSVIPEDDYDYYVGDIEEIKMFLGKAADAGNYLLFSAA